VIPVSLADWRDIIIIVVGVLTILVLLALFIFTVVLGVAARVVLGLLQRVLRDELTPLLGSARQTVSRVQGTAVFVGENAVGPIIRAYGVFAGARRAAGVLSGVAGRRNRNK
jgi:hypothetical protein